MVKHIASVRVLLRLLQSVSQETDFLQIQKYEKAICVLSKPRMGRRTGYTLTEARQRQNAKGAKAFVYLIRDSYHLIEYLFLAIDVYQSVGT